MKPANRPRIVFSASQLRTYGASALMSLGNEDQRGCPRQYRMKYVEQVQVPERRSVFAEFGTVVHETLDLMEQEDMGPEEALKRCWSPELPETMFTEASEDLRRWLDRGGPITKHGTIDTELNLEAVLYEDEDFGTVYYRGIIDWLGVDLNDGNVLHCVDFKTNRQPPRREDLPGDVQLKSYTWLVQQNWLQWMNPGDAVRVVTHLDAIKYRDVETVYSAADLEEWQAWAEAAARKILRDDGGDPYLNPGCSWCPYKTDCPVIEGLPQVGTTIAEREIGMSVDAMEAWRVEASNTVKTLTVRVKEIDERLKEAAVENGGSIRAGQFNYVLGDTKATDIDLAQLHEVTGVDFYALVKSSRSAIDAYARRNPDLAAIVKACAEYVPGTPSVKREKAVS